MSNSISKAEHRRLTAKLMKPMSIEHANTHGLPTVQASLVPIITSKGRELLLLEAGAYLDFDEASQLRDYLTRWLASYDLVERNDMGPIKKVRS